MHLEVEQKFRLADPQVVRLQLIALAARFGEPIDQADTYFAHPSRSFAQTDEALRLRQVGEHNFITYKGPKVDRQTKSRREIELPLALGAASFNQFTELLQALGFTPVATVRKRREPARLMWQGREVEVALDDVAGLGTFAELEVSAELDQLDAARDCVLSLAKEMQLTAVERRSYLELLIRNA